MNLRLMAVVVGACLPVVFVAVGATWLDGLALDMGHRLAAHTRTWLRAAEPEMLEFVTADDRPIGGVEPHPPVSEVGSVARQHVSPRRLANGAALSEPVATLPSPATSRFVSAGHVMELARRGSVPRGTSVGAAGERPPGVRYFGVVAYGVGLEEGDVLTHVAGQPVRSEEDVVTMVLSARQRRASHVAGRFWRAGESHELVVEMPYPKRVAARTQAEPSPEGLGG